MFYIGDFVFLSVLVLSLLMLLVLFKIDNLFNFVVVNMLCLLQVLDIDVDLSNGISIFVNVVVVV